MDPCQHGSAVFSPATSSRYRVSQKDTWDFEKNRLLISPHFPAVGILGPKMPARKSVAYHCRRNLPHGLRMAAKFGKIRLCPLRRCLALPDTIPSGRPRLASRNMAPNDPADFSGMDSRRGTGVPRRTRARSAAAAGSGLGQKGREIAGIGPAAPHGKAGPPRRHARCRPGRASACRRHSPRAGSRRFRDQWRCRRRRNARREDCWCSRGGSAVPDGRRPGGRAPPGAGA